MKEVVVSRRTRMDCFHRLRTSAAKEMPTASGGSSVFCCMSGSGSLRNDAQVWQVSLTRSIIFNISRA